MSEFINQFLFGIYPYLALTVFFVGSLIRYDRDQYTWKADSSQLLRSRGMRVGSNLFHIGIILLFFGHLVGLLTPEAVYHVFMSAGTKQVVAMVAGGIFGLICFVGLTILLKRRLFDPRIRATSKRSDVLILLILYVQLILGLLTIPYSAQHLDGSSMVALANWAQYIVTFRSGAADFVAHQAWVFKVHLFLGLTIFLVFPFTRLVHVFSVPFKYLSRRGYQIVRSRG
ncbi:respiratory nitrate reductase subunit gamma [Exilibacterium tricleocarpae]|uniref:nitrate reductase (quinone) n=1 Tax=Exilibacterium tricleocarpae TaxID=2591008 RepID=A0A545T007_9GAMM|nr:respiratory nitrate reductase subunit gamma [Exilibacterium tricleocarpae]TQV70557.1 respiratory nitrate reductase subunit gamma [Exilibacterium tricleocarpae]